MKAVTLARGTIAAFTGAIALVTAMHAWPQTRACPDRALPASQSNDFVTVAAQQSPAVVSITVVGAGSEGAFAGAMPPSARGPQGVGRSFASGFIFERDGFILTSAHAVGGAQAISVATADQRRFDAQLVGLDRRTDVALLRVFASDLPVVTVGRRSALCPGERVAAIGAPFGLERSLTAGVVSANPRYLAGGNAVPLIQTDVTLNPGSSGSPLFDERGNVVGMNSMIYSAADGYSGLSFSLPIDTAMRTAQELRATGRATRSHIGARTQPLTSELAPAFGLDAAVGALVVRVDADSPAEIAGLRSGDVVLAVGNAAAMPYAEVQERVASASSGSRLTLRVWRRRAALQMQVRVTADASDIVPERVARSRTREVWFGLELTERKGMLGVSPLAPGLYVRAVSGSAQRAGLRFGDALIAVNDVQVAGLADFDAAIRSVADSDTVALLIARGSTRSYVPILPRVSGRTTLTP
ncbi:trypsin-like peptidase domain-containing protein [Variovorax sp. EBFNA2]|uniref:trypsin-like peptidase domain-containing protein n=1 Tax=Variovorax sp. EBFNA2 TaxID=3342097 RepID=UPI0029BFF1CD|nr:trypsin-like peptidase domain-containing protein [Variovorax boronicumulans]WPG41388.1 trypsin-like peptidase domain-containing protein [Variovorax boronicumulans]